MDIVSVSGVIAGLKTIAEIAKTINKTIKEYDIKEKTSDLLTEVMNVQSQMLEMQSQYQELLDENKSLKDKIKQMNNWEEEKKKYEFYRSVRGGSIIRIKKEYQETEGKQALCPTCFENRMKSYLQPATLSGIIYSCPVCKSHINYNSNEL